MARLGAAALQLPGARKHSKQRALRIAAPLLAALPMFLLAAYYGYGRAEAGAGFATRSSSSSSSALADSSNSTASPVLPNVLAPQGCPAWISEYAAFHRYAKRCCWGSVTAFTYGIVLHSVQTLALCMHVLKGYGEHPPV
jgi:hypothetical protein